MPISIFKFDFKNWRRAELPNQGCTLSRGRGGQFARSRGFLGGGRDAAHDLSLVQADEIVVSALSPAMPGCGLQINGSLLKEALDNRRKNRPNEAHLYPFEAVSKRENKTKTEGNRIIPSGQTVRRVSSSQENRIGDSL